MSNTPDSTTKPVSSDAADHITEARSRARRVLAGESHVGAVDDWRSALVGARDGLILLWVVWAALHGLGHPPYGAQLLVAIAAGVAMLVGISTGRSTYNTALYFAAELDRERTEIRENPDHEMEEVRALYAAKGFEEPLLSQVVDTLVADDDRLLKVMMEEELGLSMHHINHPLLVGLWNAAAVLGAGLVLVCPLLWVSGRVADVWVPTGGTTLLAILSVLVARSRGRSAIEFFAVSMIMGIVTGGVTYWCMRWLLEAATSSGLQLV